MADSTKVSSAHLQRVAIVYVRQSTPGQVEHHRESTARQYALAERAHELGWTAEQVQVIDEDLGVSGSVVSLAKRSGFAHLTTEVALGHVGIVLGLEVSRLARSNADWYRLLDLCGVTDTLIGDGDGVYHPSLFNDRLILGLNRPDSYSTSYSTSRGSLNLLEILVGHRLRVAWTLRHPVAAADSLHVLPRERTTECGRQSSAFRRTAIAVSESSRHPPWASAACGPYRAPPRHGGRCTPRVAT